MDAQRQHGGDPAGGAAGRRLPRPGPALLAYRGLMIALTALRMVPALVAGVAVAAARGREAGRRHRYRALVRLLERLGPTFVKFGQIMSTRRDALPPALCDQLAVLHDAVTPMRRAQARSALAAAYGQGDSARFSYDQLTPVASGSIACVFRAASPGGGEVALKLRRPGIERRMTADLALMERLVRLCERLPKLRGMPIGDLTAYVSTAILGQLDFEREAASLARIRAGLAAVPGVRVPAVVADASRPGCLVMEFIPGLRSVTTLEEAPAARALLAATALLAARQMIFVDGFVHCDLHPGNLYVTREGEVVVLDAGFSVRLPDRVRLLIGEFFAALARGDGWRCAGIIVESAAAVRPGTDLDGFTEAVAALVEVNAAPEAGDFAMMSFGNALFDLQREFGLYAESDFVFPLMSLAVIESTARTVSPDLDFREIGREGAAPPGIGREGAAPPEAQPR